MSIYGITYILDRETALSNTIAAIWKTIRNTMSKAAELHMMRGSAESEGVPLYLRVAASLRTRILQGEWKVGEHLPAFEELAKTYGVAMNTIRTSVKVLSSQRLVSSARGLGTRISADAAPLLHPELKAAINAPQSRLSPEHSITMLVNREVKALSDDLDVGYGQAGRYRHIHKVHNFRGVPYDIVTAYIEKSEFDRFPKGAANSQTLMRLLQEQGKTEIASSRQELTITHADPEAASLLQYPLAAPLAKVRHWRLNARGVVIYASIVLYRSDIFVWDVTRKGMSDQGPDDEAMARRAGGSRSKPEISKKAGK